MLAGKVIYQARGTAKYKDACRYGLIQALHRPSRLCVSLSLLPPPPVATPPPCQPSLGCQKLRRARLLSPESWLSNQRGPLTSQIANRALKTDLDSRALGHTPAHEPTTTAKGENILVSEARVTGPLPEPRGPGSNPALHGPRMEDGSFPVTNLGAITEKDRLGPAASHAGDRGARLSATAGSSELCPWDPHLC